MNPLRKVHEWIKGNIEAGIAYGYEHEMKRKEKKDGKEEVERAESDGG